jgi:hypothetical protein
VAERLALRVSGSADALFAIIELRCWSSPTTNPLEGEASDKFSAPLAYDVESLRR